MNTLAYSNEQKTYINVTQLISLLSTIEDDLSNQQAQANLILENSKKSAKELLNLRRELNILEK